MGTLSNNVSLGQECDNISTITIQYDMTVKI